MTVYLRYRNKQRCANTLYKILGFRWEFKHSATH